MVKLLGIAGSLRAGSHNLRLLQTTHAILPGYVTLDIATIAGIPLYDGDTEESGFPDAVTALKERVAAADGLLLATPEYNNGVPGVFKNAIDWLSRPAADIPKLFGDKPLALCGASAGMLGSALAQAHWLPVLRHLGVRQWSGGRMLLPQAHLAFDPHGNLRDPLVLEQWRTFVSGFAAFVATTQPARGSAPAQVI
ncbi:MAG: NADPH-dependent reductase [Bradyrhizobium sp.]|nr:NADPH-dependent reductase [Bradyrhizobium sp.]